jgi:hypothetical protein
MDLNKNIYQLYSAKKKKNKKVDKEEGGNSLFGSKLNDESTVKKNLIKLY